MDSITYEERNLVTGYMDAPLALAQRVLMGLAEEDQRACFEA